MMLFDSLDPSSPATVKVRRFCARNQSWHSVEQIEIGCLLSRDAANGAIQKLLKEHALEKEVDRGRGNRLIRQRYRFRVRD
jgi:hypothetical protein